MEFLSNQSYSDLNNIQDNTPNLYYQYIITPVRVKYTSVILSCKNEICIMLFI
jgi:hypothetical protein